MVVGLVLAWISRPYFRPFFSRKTETAAPGLLDATVERAPLHLMGSEHVTHGADWLTPRPTGRLIRGRRELPRRAAGRPRRQAALRHRLSTAPGGRTGRAARVSPPDPAAQAAGSSSITPCGEPYSASSSRNGSAGKASGPSTPVALPLPAIEQLERHGGVDRRLPDDRLAAVLAHRVSLSTTW